MKKILYFTALILTLLILTSCTSTSSTSTSSETNDVNSVSTGSVKGDFDDLGGYYTIIKTYGMISNFVNGYMDYCQDPSELNQIKLGAAQSFTEGTITPLDDYISKNKDSLSKDCYADITQFSSECKEFALIVKTTDQNNLDSSYTQAATISKELGGSYYKAWNTYELLYKAIHERL